MPGDCRLEEYKYTINTTYLLPLFTAISTISFRDLAAELEVVLRSDENLTAVPPLPLPCDTRYRRQVGCLYSVFNIAA